MKIREYTLVQDKYRHPKLEEINCYEWEGELVYCDEIHRMFKEVFRMNRLSIEKSYVVAFDHAKKLKGICQVGQGNSNETAMPLQNIFTFLLLTGAASFIVAHNHVSDMPQASEEDKIKTMQLNMHANIFEMEFIGHMIISPNEYIIDGGVIGNETEYKEEGEIEYLDNGMAATYIFGNRIEGKREDIETICGIE